MEERGPEIAVVDEFEVVGLGVAAAMLAVRGPSVSLITRRVHDVLRRPGEFAVVLLDPDLDQGMGLEECVRRLRRASLEVVLFARTPTSALAASARAFGARAVLAKAASPTRIRDVVRRAVGAAALEPYLGRPGTLPAGLTAQEAQVLRLYASGAKAVTVAHEVGLTVNTVNTYVRRIREKYELAGRPTPTRVDLYHRAKEDGLLAVE